MADISTVEEAVVDTLTSILYPAGASGASVVGALCRIYRGWPNSSTLNSDLSAGIVNVTVSAENGSGKTTTRYLSRWQATAAQPSTTASVSGQVVTISGTPAKGDVVGIVLDGVPYAYRVDVGDTSSLIASNLTGMILPAQFATSRGPQITVLGASRILARVVCDSAASFESRRQEKDLRIICWCPTPTLRDALASEIDGTLNSLNFLPLPDTSNARIAYRNTDGYDQGQNALLYRRDLIYTLEYPTITVLQQPSMLFGSSNLNKNITYG